MARTASVFFWLGCLFVAIASFRTLFLPMQSAMPNMAHYLPIAPFALYAHILAAPIALGLAPFQLSRSLRRRHHNLHRAIGYTYGAAVLVGGTGALALMPAYLGNGWSAAGFALLGIGWIGTTVIGIGHAMAGNYEAHRRWMMRSVALSFSAVTLRLIMAPLMASGWSVVETYNLTAWVSWLPNLLLVELWIRRTRGRHRAV